MNTSLFRKEFHTSSYVDYAAVRRRVLDKLFQNEHYVILRVVSRYDPAERIFHPFSLLPLDHLQIKLL